MLIICNGMKRSSSTLQYNWVISVLKITGNYKIEGFFTIEKYLNNIDDFKNWIKDSQYHVIKSHNFLPIYNIEEKLNKKKIKIVYIHRDLRDVTLSLRKKSAAKYSEIIETIPNMLETYYTIKDLSNVLMQKYEYVIKNKESSLKDISNYLGIETNEEQINKIIEENSIKNFQYKIKNISLKYKVVKILNDFFKKIPFIFRKISKKIGITELIRNNLIPKNIVIDKSNLHLDHISDTEGRTAVFKEEMPIEIIKIIENKFNNYLKSNNYIK